MLQDDYAVMKKYEKGRLVEEADRPVLENWAIIGDVRFSYSISEGRETAKLTDMGMSRIEREELRRNPVRRFLHAWAESIQYP